MSFENYPFQMTPMTFHEVHQVIAKQRLWLNDIEDRLGATTPAVPAALANEKYIVQEASANLSAEQSLGALATGILKNTTTASVGVLSIAVADTDYTANAFKTIACTSGTNPVADSAADTLTLTAGTGVTITGDSATDTVTIAATGAANSFTTIDCPSGTDPVADSATDTLVLASGTTALTITGDSSTDTVTFDLAPGTDGLGDVTSSSNITDHSIVRGDGGAKGVQDSGILIDDSDHLTMPTSAQLRLRDTSSYVYSSGSGVLRVVGTTEVQVFGPLSVYDGTASHLLFASFDVASAVNYLGLLPSATTSDLEIQAIGSDTDISINMIPKGAGVLRVNGVDVLTTATGQPLDATLTDLAALSAVQGDIIYASGSDDFSLLNKDTNATRYLSNTGTSNNPAWAQVNLANGVTGTLVVANGGSGVTSATAYAVLCGGTTSTNPFQSIASVGTSGQVLTSNGAGALPTFQDAASGSGDVTTSGTPQEFSLVMYADTTGDLIADSLILTDGNGTLLIDDNALNIRDGANPSNHAHFNCDSLSGQREFTFQDSDGTLALLGNKLSAFAATTSAELAGVISDETGSGALVFASGPTLTSPIMTGPVIGTGAAATDYALTFNGETNDGVLTWMEDEDYFAFSDGVLFNTAEELYFRATTQRIYSSAADTLDIDAPTLRLNPNNPGDIVLGDGTERDMYPQTDLKINLGGSSNRFNEGWIHELHVQQSVANVSNPPTDAELDSAFGTPASLGRGFVATVDDADGDTTFWLVATSDASWYYVQMTKAT